MAVLPPHLAVMVASHLTKTETHFLHYTTPPVLSSHIPWDELYMSISLCLYGLQYMPEYPVEFLMAIVTTASYSDIRSPAITALLRRHRKSATTILNSTIKAHRPISMLAHLFQLYSCSCRDKYADDYCNYAASANNTEALDWLRDPKTGDGSYPWSYRTTVLAARYGHIAMLHRLRDPTIDGGICSWGMSACTEAARTGQLAALVWLRNPKTGGGVCPWEKNWCLDAAQQYNYSEITAWIHTQPDDN
jgi:hypothetical protein